MSQVLNITLQTGINITVSGSSDQLPTPLVLVLLQAQQLNDALYIHIAATGIYVWDVLNNLRNDFKLISEHKIGIPTILYFAVRLSLLVYCIGRAVLLTAQIDNCELLETILNVLIIIVVGGLTTLFYLRVVAVYNKNPYVIACFGTTWLSTLALIGTVFVSFNATHFSAEGITSKYCQETITADFLIGTFIDLLVNDLLIYIAISYRIYRIFLDYDFEADWKRKLVILFFGASLPVESKIVLLESQLYCLVVVASKIFIVTMISIDHEKNAMYIICHLVLSTVLSSRVYRELRQIGVAPQQRTDFQTGNLTSAEFGDRVGHSTGRPADRAECSMQERGSRKTAGIEDDFLSIGGTTTRSTGLENSVSDVGANRLSDDFNARTWRCGEDDRSHSSRNALYDAIEPMERV